MSNYDSINPKACAIQLKNKIELVRILENENIQLTNEIHKLKEELKKVRGDLSIVIMDSVLQEVVLKQHAMDKPIGNIYTYMKTKGYEITIEEIQAVVNQIDELPRDLREYYEYEREYYKKNKLNTSTHQVNQSLNSLELVRDLTTIRLVKLGENENQIDLESFDKMWNNAVNTLMKTNQAIAKLRQEDGSYKIELSNEIKEAGNREMKEYTNEISKIINIKDIINNSNYEIENVDPEVLYND